MTTMDSDLIKRLKNKIKILQKKEEKSRRQLTLTLQKMRALADTYKTKWVRKIHVIQKKVGASQASTYAKMALQLERQLLKNIKAKEKALKIAINKLEKKHMATLAKNFSDTAKKVNRLKKKKISQVMKAVRQTIKTREASKKKK